MGVAAKSFSLVRGSDWFLYKIPPLLAVGYALILALELPFSEAVLTLFLVLLCILSVAAYGHVVNDIFDIHEDLDAGKANAMARFSPLQRTLFCALFVAMGAAPFVFHNLGASAAILLGINYLLPTAYSIPPVRLKERGVLGVATDALGAHMVPTLFMAASMLERSATPGLSSFALLGAAALWSFCLGLRGIIVHQVLDRNRDIRANVATFVAGARRRRPLRNFVLHLTYPFEVVGLLAFVVLLLPVSPALGAFAAIFVFAETLKIVFAWKQTIFYPERPAREPYIPLLNNEFYEVWLPCALVIQLVFEDARFALVFAMHVLVFRVGIVKWLGGLAVLGTDTARRLHLRLFGGG